MCQTVCQTAIEFQTWEQFYPDLKVLTENWKFRYIFNIYVPIYESIDLSMYRPIWLNCLGSFRLTTKLRIRYKNVPNILCSTWCRVSPIINILNQSSSLVIEPTWTAPTVHTLHQGSLLVECWFEQMCCCCWVAQSHLTLHDPMDCSKHSRPPCPSPSPEVFPSSGPLHWWCHPTISSSGALFLFCPQSLSASRTFLISQLFTSDNKNTGASASASVLPMSIQGWFPLTLTGLISLLSKGLSGVFSSTTVWRHQFFGTLPSSLSSSQNHMWPLGRP